MYLAKLAWTIMMFGTHKKLPAKLCLWMLVVPPAAASKSGWSDRRALSARALAAAKALAASLSGAMIGGLTGQWPMVFWFSHDIPKRVMWFWKIFYSSKIMSTKIGTCQNGLEPKQGRSTKNVILSQWLCFFLKNKSEWQFTQILVNLWGSPDHAKV